MDDDIEYGFTIRRLSERLDIPVNIVRRDIAELFSMPENGYLYFDDSELEDYEPSELRKYVIDGSADAIPIISAMPFRYAQAEIPFATKSNDTSIIMAYFGLKLVESKDTDYLIKKSYRFRETQGLIYHLQGMDMAINAVSLQ